MDTKGYVISGLYFMIWSEDEAELYFTAESMIFVGMNIDGPKDHLDRWYFQDARSYCALGVYPDLSEPETSEDKAHVHLLRAIDLDRMVDSDGLAALLVEHAARRALAGIADQLGRGTKAPVPPLPLSPAPPLPPR